jgi:hypothetical protein
MWLAVVLTVPVRNLKGWYHRQRGQVSRFLSFCCDRLQISHSHCQKWRLRSAAFAGIKEDHKDEPCCGPLDTSECQTLQGCEQHQGLLSLIDS